MVGTWDILALKRLVGLRLCTYCTISVQPRRTALHLHLHPHCEYAMSHPHRNFNVPDPDIGTIVYFYTALSLTFRSPK